MSGLDPAGPERNRFRAVIDQFPSAAAVYQGPDHVVVAASEAYHRIVGRRDLLGHPFREALPELVGQGFLALLDQAYASGEPATGTDARADWDDDGDGQVERHYVDFTYQPLKDADGSVWGLVVHVVDATARHDAEAALQEQAAELEHQVEEVRSLNEELEESQQQLLGANEALRESETRFRLMFERNPLPMWIFDLETLRIMDANQAALDRYGYTRDELLALTIRDMRPPEDLPRLDAVLNQPGRQGLVIRGNHRHRWKDGTVRDVEVTTSETIFQGRPARVALIQDITDRVRAEERLAILARAGDVLSSSLEPAETLAALAGLVVPAVADWCFVEVRTPEGRIEPVVVHHADPARVHWGRMAVSRYPVDPDAPHGTAQVLRSGEPELVPEIPPEFVGLMARDEGHRQALEEAAFRSYLSVPLHGREGTFGVLSLAMSESPRRFSEEDLPFVQEVARRAAVALENARLLESERRARDEAEAASRAKSAFLATMSHELRTPLNAMLGYSDLLLLGIPEPVGAAALEQVRRMDRATRHLLSIIEEILTFSRIEAGREEAAAEPVDVPALVREVVAIAEPLAAARGLRFVAPEAVEPVPMVTDPRKLRQILINMLGNAVKFTQQGEIEFSVDADGNGLRFAVRDTGIGIAPEHLDRVFEPFWQVDAGPTRGAEGTGLGLAVSRQLARILGGDLSVTSEPGQGSVFTLRLPSTPN